MKNQISQVTGYPFVSHVDQNQRPILNNPAEFIKKVYLSPFYTNADNIFKFGYYKNMGYLFDLKPMLKKYLFKQHGRWEEIYAPNKTAVRKVIYGKINKIIELK
jgi:hypothetical protein